MSSPPPSTSTSDKLPKKIDRREIERELIKKWEILVTEARKKPCSDTRASLPYLLGTGIERF